MFNWLRQQFNRVSGRIDNTVRNWVNDVFNGVYGYLHSIFSVVGAEWGKLSTWTANLYYQIHDVLSAIYVKLYWIIRVGIPNIISEYRRIVHDAVTFANQILQYAVNGIAWVTHLAESLVNSAINWVIANVWTPLTHDIALAWDWITHTGAIVWGYISHPDRLAELVFDSLLAILEREAWTVADRLGKFFISLVVKNLQQFALLIEDILDAIL